MRQQMPEMQDHEFNQLSKLMIWHGAFLLITFLTFMSGAQANDSLPAELKGHGGPIKAITVSPNGKRALTASFDYSIILWDLNGTEAKIVHRMFGHDFPVNDVLFVAGSEKAVSVSDDGSLGIWDLTEGELIKRINSSNHKVLDVALSSDGALALASRWDGTARLYDVAAAKEIATFSGHRGNVNSAVFSEDGLRVYSAAYDGQIIEWNTVTGEMIRPLYRHGWGINSIDRIDNDRLVFGALDGSVIVVDVTSGDKIAELAKSERPIQSVKVSQDRIRIAYGDGGGSIGVFQADDGAEIETAPVTFGPVWDFDFVPESEKIYHVGLDDFAALWQISPSKPGQIKAQYPRRFQVRDTDDPGALEFQRKCSVCHTLTPDGKNRAGPTLYKIFGRKIGSIPDYPYTKALADSDIVWNEDTIAQLFDEGPDVMLPGTKMPLQRLKSIERRDDLIRFLKKATQ